MFRRKRKPINFVMIEGGASDAEVEQVRELFLRRGLRAEVNAGLPLAGGPPTELVWGVYVALAVPITSFFAALGTQAGKDVYDAAKDWVLELIAARRSEEGPGQITPWWWFRKEVYVERDDLTSQDVTALALQMQHAKDATLEVAHAEMRGEESAKAVTPREPIPEHVRHEVWRRDQGRCVDCGSRERLEFDHIIPVNEGGSNSARNIELCCETCNRRKEAKSDLALG